MIGFVVILAFVANYGGQKENDTRGGWVGNLQTWWNGVITLVEISRPDDVNKY